MEARQCVSAISEIQRLLKTLPGQGNSDQQLAAACAVLSEKNKLLPPFRAKTLYAQWQRILTDPTRPWESSQPHGTAQQAQQPDDEAGPSTAGAAGPSSGTAQQAKDEQDAAACPQGQQQAQQQGSPSEQTSPEALRPKQTEDPRLLAGAWASESFIPTGGWMGCLDGYVFKSGEAGLGYYKDEPPKEEPLSAEMVGD